MADQIVTNEVPATTNAWFSLFRLYETMVAAGWTVVESSQGSGDGSFGASDRWAGAFGSLVSNAWTCLQANSGQQIVFRRGGTSNTDGWIVWLKDGGYTAGVNSTDVLPSDLPADAVFIRGTGAVAQTYTTDGPWFGASVNSVATLHIGCRDASGTGDESFWLIAQVPGQSYSTSTASAVHRIAFERVEHMAGLGIVDANPYAWWVPESNTSNWADGLDDLQSILHEDNLSGTQGVWRRWWNAGQGGESFELYGSGSNYQGDGSGADATGDNPNFDDAFASNSDEVIYQATPVQLIRRIRLTKVSDTGLEDPEGGFSQNVLFTSKGVANLDTLNSGAYAKFGAWLVVWWDGNAGNPPVEN